MLSAGGVRLEEHTPERYRELATRDQQGGSCIIDPQGTVIATAKDGEEEIITSTISLEPVFAARGASDNGGHYSRPDVLQLHVNRASPQRLVEHNLSDGRFALSAGEALGFAAANGDAGMVSRPVREAAE